MIGCLCLGVVGCFPWVEPGVSWWLWPQCGLFSVVILGCLARVVGGFGLNLLCPGCGLGFSLVLLVSCFLSCMDYVLFFLCPGCGLMFIASRFSSQIACCPIYGDWLLSGLLVLALYVGILYRDDAPFLGFRGGAVRFFFFG